MLAYVFAHRPAPDVAPAEYVAALSAFHAALTAAPPAGFRGSWVWRVGAAYEDWYAVDGWAALGALNEAAVAGARQAPHDVAAAMAGPGSGAIYALVSGEPRGSGRVRWRVAKPAGTAYAAFEAALVRAAGSGTVWKRQMVLGADREFLVDATGRPPGPVGGAEVGAVALEQVVGR